MVERESYWLLRLRELCLLSLVYHFNFWINGLSASITFQNGRIFIHIPSITMS